jgi:hypothetical protein
MIYARKDCYGMLWQFRKGDGEELDQAREYARTRHEVPYSLTDLL